jgi:4-hydroxybenzoate polyprenyltransferase
MLVGYLLAVGASNAFRSERLATAIVGVVLWVVCLNGGTLALNSAFDQDEGDVAYLRNPPPPPRRLAAFGIGIMIAGLGGALLLPRAYWLTYALCVVLSVLYSVPPFRLKSVPGADWLINMWGFGTLTPYAGWATTGMPVGIVGKLLLLAFCPLFAALYPLTQIYQFEEDARRRDRTLALFLGVRWSLIVALAATVVSFALFGLAGQKAGWDHTESWRWFLLVLAAVGWCVVLVPWLIRHHRMTAGEHQQGMYRALFAWALTDVAVVLAWGT